MGLYLSQPLTNKDNDVKDSQKLAGCSSEMQGWRIHMEDAHILELDDAADLALMGVFDGHGGPAVSKWVAQNFMRIWREERATLEGQIAGNTFNWRKAESELPVGKIALIAQALENTFLRVDVELQNQDSQLETDLRCIQEASQRKRKREMLLAGVEEPTSTTFFRDLMDVTKKKKASDDGSRAAVPDEGLSFDDILQDEIKKDEAAAPENRMGFGERFNVPSNVQEKRTPFDPQSCGCTSVVAAVIFGEQPVLIAANAGDSRCVLSRNGEARQMTIDHKPLQERELMRIRAAGGKVVNGRVDSNLNLSRSLGDFHYKRHPGPAIEQKICAVPDLTYIPLCKDDDFVILACDGIWDILTIEQCAAKVHKGWADYKEDPETKDLSDAELCKLLAQDLCDECLAPTPFDAESAGAGCDNMTAMVIRIKDEWRSSLPAVSQDESMLYGTPDELANYNLIELKPERSA